MRWSRLPESAHQGRNAEQHASSLWKEMGLGGMFAGHPAGSALATLYLHTPCVICTFFSLIFPNFLKNFEDAEKSKNSAVNPKILTRFLNFCVLSYLLDLSLHLSIHTHTSFLFCCFAGPLENKLWTSRCFTSNHFTMSPKTKSFPFVPHNH